jgi:hypothetical protein
MGATGTGNVLRWDRFIEPRYALPSARRYLMHANLTSNILFD